MANFGDDIFFSSIPELNAKLQARDFSARELARAFCGRIEELGPRYNALALSLRKSALNQAGDVDGDLKRNRFRGPLQGIPYGVKDSLSIAYLPTAWGARPYADQRFDHDAAVIAKLNSVGAIATSKLSMIELAGAGGYSFPSSSIYRPRTESLEHRPLVRRLFQRPGRRRCLRSGLLRAGFGNLRLHPASQRLLRRHRLAPYLRLCLPLWRHGGGLEHG